MNQKNWNLVYGIVCFIAYMTLGMIRQIFILNKVPEWQVITLIFSTVVFTGSGLYLWMNLFYPLLKKYLNKADKIKRKI